MGCSGICSRMAQASRLRRAALLPQDPAAGTYRNKSAADAQPCPLALLLQFLFGAEAEVSLAFAAAALRVRGKFPAGRTGDKERTVRPRPALRPNRAPATSGRQSAGLRSGLRCARRRCLRCAAPSRRPCWRANSQLNNAVRALPTCRCPVGDGAKRTRTVEFAVTQ